MARCRTRFFGPIAALSVMTLAAGFWGCAPRAAGVPPGPPPEYERPELPPWDGGAAPASKLARPDAGGLP